MHSSHFTTATKYRFLITGLDLRCSQLSSPWAIPSWLLLVTNFSLSSLALQVGSSCSVSEYKSYSSLPCQRSFRFFATQKSLLGCRKRKILEFHMASRKEKSSVIILKSKTLSGLLMICMQPKCLYHSAQPQHVVWAWASSTKFNTSPKCWAV